MERLYHSEGSSHLDLSRSSWEYVSRRDMRTGIVFWKPTQFKVGFLGLGLIALGILWLFMGVFGKEVFSFLA